MFITLYLLFKNNMRQGKGLFTNGIITFFEFQTPSPDDVIIQVNQSELQICGLRNLSFQQIGSCSFAAFFLEHHRSTQHDQEYLFVPSETVGSVLKVDFSVEN